MVPKTLVIFLLFMVSSLVANSQKTALINKDSCLIRESPRKKCECAENLRSIANDSINDAPDFALKYYQWAIDIAEEYVGNDTLKGSKNGDPAVIVFKSFLNAGICEVDRNNEPAAEKWLKEAASRYQQYQQDGILNLDGEVYGRVFHNLGKTYLKTKGFKAAEDQYKRAIEVQKKSSSLDILRAYISLSELYIPLKDGESMLQTIGLAKQVIEQNHSKWKESINFLEKKAKLLHNEATAYELLDSLVIAHSVFDEAFQLYSTLYEIYDKKKEKEDALFSKANLLNDRAYLAIKEEKYNKAYYLVNQAIKIVLDSLGEIDYRENLSAYFNTRGDIKLADKNFPSAIDDFRKSISYNFASDSTTRVDLEQFLDGETDAVPVKRLYLLTSLAGLANCYYKKENNDIEQAEIYFEWAVKHIENLRNGYTDPATNMKLGTRIKEVFEDAIEFYIEKEKEQDAYELAQKSKAFALTQSIQQQQAILAFENDTLLNKYFLLKRSVDSLKYGVSKSASKQAEMIRLQEALDAQEEELLKKSETFDRFNKLSNPSSIKELRENLLAEDQALVEYFIGERKCYIFILRNGSPLEVVVKNETRKNVEKSINEFAFHLGSDPQYSDTVLLAEHASKLYNLIFDSVAIKLDTIKRVMIIPDGLLGKVSYDALLPITPEKKNDLASFQFLGKEWIFSYCYSTSLLKILNNPERSLNKKKIRQRMLAYFLEGAGYFKDKAGKMFARKYGNKYVHMVDEANIRVEHFRENGPKYQLLHFTVHGIANPQDPNYSYLELYEDSLFLYKLYGIPLHADLVVANACKVAEGMHYNGEGVVSIARGFFVAGAQSVITNFWEANEAATGPITEGIYEALTKDEAKDVALHSAKKQLLAKGEYLHPYHWANLNLHGNLNSLEFPSSSIKIYWISGILIVVIIFLLLLVFRMKRASIEN